MPCPKSALADFGSGLILLLSLLVGLVFILFPYFYLVAVLFVLCIFFLSYSPAVTFNIQSDFAVCIFCYHVFPLPLRIARFPVCLFLFVCLRQPVTGSAVTSCCRVIDLWSTFHQPFCLHFIFRAMSYTIFRCKVSDSGARQGPTSCFARKKSK